LRPSKEVEQYAAMSDVTACMMDVVTEKSGHTMTGMAVSVCLTPAAPSPLPIPYPTVGTSGEGITDPAMRTKVCGSKVMTVGSCIKACHGNEPGTLKEVVSLNTAGPCFPALGAPIVICELGMMGITGSIGQMNKSITVGAGANASGAGGGAGGGGGGGGNAGGPGGKDPNNPNNKGGGGGGGNQGAGPPKPPGPPGADGQAKTGHPVDVITGTMYTLPAIDADLRGPLPMQWARHYRTSAVRRRCGIGWGWSHTFAWRAEENDQGIVVTDSEGASIEFPLVEDGTRAAAPYGRTLERSGSDLVLATRDGARRTLSRSAPGKYLLVAVCDADGNRTRVSWDPRGYVDEVVDCAGRKLRIEREQLLDVLHLVVVDADGREHRRLAASYRYDERGDLVAATDAGGATTTYRYDDSHFLLEEGRPDGVIFKFVYEDGPDGIRRCVETWGELPGTDIVATLKGYGGSTARGIFHSRLRYAPGNQTTVVDAEGGTHRYQGNDRGQVTRYVDPLGRSTAYRYDQNGELVRVEHPQGVVEQYVHDAEGRIVRMVVPNGRTLTFRRDSAGNIIEMIDLAGSRWRMAYDGAGRMMARTKPDGVTGTCSYDERGLPVAVAGPGGVETWTYDNHGNPIERSDVRGARWRYAWDLLGMPVRIETPSGCSYELAYDSRGDIVEVRSPHGRVMRRELDASGNIVTEEHPGGGVTTRRFVAGARVEHTLPDGRRYRTGFDALLRPIWIESPAGDRHLFEYDAAGQLVRERSFAGVETRYEHDGVGRRVRESRGQGSVSYVLDPIGDLVRLERSDGYAATFERDARGLVVKASNQSTSVTLERDDAGQVVREIQEVGGWRFVVEHDFDPLGYETARRYSSGWSVQLRRGLGGAIEALEVHDASGNVEEAVEIEHGIVASIRRAGRKDAIRVENDRLGRSTRVTVTGEDGVVLRDRSYRWAAQPGLLAVDDDRAGRTYELDLFGRPVRVRGAGADDVLDYSPEGTPLSQKRGDVVGAVGRKLSAGSARFDWDARGRLAARHDAEQATSWTFEYDQEDRLVAAVRGDGLAIRYVYDPFGRRLAALRSDGSSTFFGWDRDSLVEHAGPGGDRERRVFDDDGYTPLLDSVDGRSWRLVASDFARTPWLFLGSGGDVAELELTALGEDARVTGHAGRMRYAGQHADDDTGLRYNHHRYYAPELGTFITPDPLVLRGSLHDIGFVPNATEYLDPLGLIIVLGSYDKESVDAANARKAATGQEIVHANKLTSTSLAGHDHVEVITHGSPTNAQAVFQDGGKKWKNGKELGTALKNAGMSDKANVVVVACMAADKPGGKQSVIEGVNSVQGNPTTGPTGIAYVRPYDKQACGVCPQPGPGKTGSVDLTNGQWNTATGPAGGPSTQTANGPPTTFPGSWDDPSAKNAPGWHGHPATGDHNPPP
jgi:RHS repeat-associated protein